MDLVKFPLLSIGFKRLNFSSIIASPKHVDYGVVKINYGLGMVNSNYENEVMATI